MQLKSLVLVSALLVANWLKGQSNENIINYINTYKGLAMKEMQRSGVPAAITLAQGIHETMAGKSDLVLRSNNHFGIKCKGDWTGDRVYHDDDARGECFRSYRTAADSYRDHSEFLRNSSRYAALFRLPPTDYKDWAYGLKKAGYATNIQYPEILIRLIEGYNLEQYTLIAMGKLSPDQELMAGSQAPVMIHMSDESGGLPADAPPVVVHYPQGEFEINRAKVVYVKAGASLLAVAQQYNVPLRRLLDFNDMPQEDVLARDQLIFLRRKRKLGNTDYHTVQPGESLYEISQAEGIRLESLEKYNHLGEEEQPAPGQKLYLRDEAPTRPRLTTETEMVAQSTASPGEGTGETDSASHPPEKPGVISHLVKSHETLYGIARKYGVEVEQIRQWNKLEGYDLQIGQTLLIYKN